MSRMRLSIVCAATPRATVTGAAEHITIVKADDIYCSLLQYLRHLHILS